MKKQVVITAAVLALGTALGGYNLANAAAGSKDQAEVQALTSAKVTITDAIKAVQAVEKGTVAEIQFDQKGGGAAYEVSAVSADGAEHHYLVDAATAKVEKLAADQDREGTHEDGDEDSEG